MAFKGVRFDSREVKMVEKCAVCGQSLPAGVTAVEMHRRLDELGATAAAEAATKLRKELDKEFQTWDDGKGDEIEGLARC